MSSLMELLKQKKQSLQSNNRQKTVKPGDGRTRWRILPSWRKPTDENPEIFYHDFGQHFIKDHTGTLKAVYVCVDKTFGKPCQICGAIEHAMKSSTDDAMVELLKESKASQRILVNAIQVDGPNPNDPAILELAPGVFAGFLGIVEEWGVDVLSLDKGHDVIIERTGKGINTKYSVQVAAKSQPVDASIMKRVVNLDEYVAQESEEQAKRALTNLQAVSGLLPAAPAAAAPVADRLRDISLDDDFPGEYATAAAPAAPTPAASAPTAAAEPAPAASSDDTDLDALLAGLG